MVLALLAPGVLPAQEFLYTNSFEGVKEQQHPQGWTFIGAEGPQFWFVTLGALCTGNGDDYKYGDCYAILDDPKAADWTDYTVQVSFWCPQTLGQVLLVARWQNRDNYYLAVLSTGIDNASEPNYAQLVKVENGQRFILNEAVDGKNGVSIPDFKGDSAAAARQLRFSVNGQSLTLYLDGRQMVTAENATFNKGTFGLGQRENLVYFDNVLIIPGQGSATLPISQPTEVEAAPTQEAPSSPGAVTALPTSTFYRLVIMEGLDRARAEQLRAEILKDFPSVIDVVPQPDGTYAIYFGVFLSQQEALTQMSNLVEEGLTVRRVVEVSGQQGAQVFQQASSGSGRDTRFRVVAQEFPDPGTAESMKRALEESGYFPVEVVPAAGRYRVLCGLAFPTRADAEILANDLKGSGYFAATVAEVRAEGLPGTRIGTLETASAPTVITEKELSDIAASQGIMPTREELAQVQDIIQRRQQIEQGMPGDVLSPGEAYQKLVAQIQQLSEGQKALVQKVEEQEAARQQKERKVREVKIAVNAAQDAKDYPRALDLLNEWEELEPNDAGVDVKRRLIENLMKGPVDVEGQLEKERETRLEKQVKVARQAEADGDLQQSLILWRGVRGEASPNTAAYGEAEDSIKRLGEELDRRREAEREAQDRNKLMMLLAVVGIVVLVAIVAAVLIIMMMRSRRRDQELLRQVQELSVRPLRELEEGKAPKLIEGDQAPSAPAPAPRPAAAPPVPPAPAPPQPAAEATASADDTMRITSPIEIPEAPPPPAAPKPAASSDVPLTPSFEPEGPAPRHTGPASAPARPELPPLPPLEPPSFEAPSADPFAAPSAASSDPISAGPGPDKEAKDKEVPSFGHTMPESFLDIPSQDDLTAILTGSYEPPKAEEQPPAEAPPSPPQAPPEPSFEPSPAEAEVPAETQPADAPPPEPPSFLFDEKLPVSPPPAPPEAKPAAVAPEAPAPPVPEAAPPAIPPMESAPVPLAPPVPAAASVPVPAPVTAPSAGLQADDGKVVYAQNFDDEEDGSKPRNWTGDYDYSSLVVSAQTPASDSTRCLRFEKRQGSGSAYYSCRFPDVAGRLVVEFDLRCDDKNKYLLGFYIEKDEDFRQSIHTIVHRTSPQVAPTLRVQGEPTQYSLGTWRHMRYEIDLQANQVNGYVDGELVADKVKLASPPKSINTLSIRDNLATTGILLIDNIKIVKL